MNFLRIGFYNLIRKPDVLKLIYFVKTWIFIVIFEMIGAGPALKNTICRNYYTLLFKAQFIKRYNFRKLLHFIKINKNIIFTEYNTIIINYSILLQYFEYTKMNFNPILR
ncbi:Uncharacterized protein A9P81_0472 [Leptospira interrogans serovar Copenhageni/Icterohaemorrhagiae]|nr:Uncharacterized protein A9P81_0472 [Leptospira interrogans serovar Copenhageni/Icterohaemorrhagiae]